MQLDSVSTPRVEVGSVRCRPVHYVINNNPRHTNCSGSRVSENQLLPKQTLLNDIHIDTLAINQSTK